MRIPPGAFVKRVKACDKYKQDAIMLELLPGKTWNIVTKSCVTLEAFSKGIVEKALVVSDKKLANNLVSIPKVG